MIAHGVADARRNAKINGIKKYRFVCVKTKDVMDSLLKEYFQHLDMTTKIESDIKENMTDKSDDNMTKEFSSKSKEHSSDSSVPTNVEDNNIIRNVRNFLIKAPALYMSLLRQMVTLNSGRKIVEQSSLMMLLP